MNTNRSEFQQKLNRKLTDFYSNTTRLAGSGMLLLFLLTISFSKKAPGLSEAIILLAGCIAIAWSTKTEILQGRRLLYQLLPIVIISLLPIRVPFVAHIFLAVSLTSLLLITSSVMQFKPFWETERYRFVPSRTLAVLAFLAPPNSIWVVLAPIIGVVVFARSDWLQRETRLRRLFISTSLAMIAVTSLINGIILPRLMESIFIGDRITSVFRFFTVVFLTSSLLLLLRIVITPTVRAIQTRSPIRTKLILTFVFNSLLPFVIVVLISACGSWYFIGSYQSSVVEKMINENISDMQQSITTAKLKPDSTGFVAPVTTEKYAIAKYVMLRSASKEPGKHRFYLRPDSAIGYPFRQIIVEDSSITMPFGGMYIEGSDKLVYFAANRRSGGFAAATRMLTVAELEQIKQMIGSDLSVYGLLTVGMDSLAENTSLQIVQSEDSLKRHVAPLIFLRTKRDSTLTSGWNAQFPIGLTYLPLLRTREKGDDAGALVVLYAAPKDVFVRLFNLKNPFNYGLAYLFSFAILILLLLILVAVNLGFQISNLISEAADRLIQGTLALRQGKLEHRIPVESNDELGEVAYSFNLMAGELTRMVDEIRVKERLERDIQIARSIQVNLMPRETPRLPGWQIAARNEFAQDIGGDFFDFIPLTDNRWGITLGDVSGKGIPAALLMSNVQASLRFLSTIESDPGKLLARLNDDIYHSTAAELFVTVFYAILEPISGRLTYVNAGHDHPLFFQNGSVLSLETGGTIIGAFSRMEYEVGTVQFQPKDQLIIFSDGIPEAEGEGGYFSDARLRAAATKHLTSDADTALDGLFREVNEFVGDTPPSDDRTVIWMKRL